MHKETRRVSRHLVLVVCGVLSVTVSMESAAQAPADSGALEEVVVSARKRNESIQDIPIAVSAVTEAAMERQQFRDLRDMSFSVPNLIAYKNQTTANSSAPFIRGVGQDDSTPVAEQGVATYVDDVYMARSQGALVDLIDFERIEVLRGPQGTLYGRNSSGGALRFVTRKPSLTESRLIGDITLGSFDRLDLRASYSLPLVQDKVGVKFEAVARDRDGYMTRVDNGDLVNRIDRQAARMSLRYAITEDVMLDFAWDGARDRSGIQTPSAIRPAANGRLPGGYEFVYGDPYRTGADVRDKNEYNGWGASSILTWQTGLGEFKSVSAYRRFDNEFYSDLGGRPANLDLFRVLDHRQFTQEFQLASSGEGALNYAVGLFYLDEKFHNVDVFLFLDDYFQTTKSYAVYGEGTYQVFDRMRVTVGGRYTQDKKSIDGNYIGLGGAFSVTDLKADFSNFSPKLGVDYRLSDQALIYATVTEGYKAGGFQGFPQNLTDITQEIVRPEDVRAFEIGAKTEWLDGRVIVNGAAYFSDYTDRQVNSFNPATLGFVARSLDAEIKGIELEFTARLTENVTLSGFFSTLDGKVTRADATDPLVPPVGKILPFVPDVSGKIGIDWNIPVANGGEWFVGTNVAYKGKIYFATFNEPFAVQNGHELVDARVGFRTADQKLEVSLGGRNLTDKQWADTGAVIDGGVLWMAEPRTWSVTFRYMQ
jgi:iron complex outermembrane receptor protein